MNPQNEMQLCITSFNELPNLPRLRELFDGLRNSFPGRLRILVVDNGSTDGSISYLSEWSIEDVDVEVYRLEENVRYGGGMGRALSLSSSSHVCMLPADGQYSLDDIEKCIFHYLSLNAAGSRVLVKGTRKHRDDPLTVRMLSGCYRLLCSAVLGIPRIDVNGLPKIFCVNGIDLDPKLLPSDAVFDAALLARLLRSLDHLEEVPVTFNQRLHGTASWSGKRLKTSVMMFISLLRVRLKQPLSSVVK